MTTIYFVRHAESNYKNHEDAARELTAKGLEDRKLVSGYLSDKNIDVVLSSPYKRAIDTVKHFAERNQLTVEIIEDFRERKVDSGWIEDFDAFCRRQWEDFAYKRSDGETVRDGKNKSVRTLGQMEGNERNGILIRDIGEKL